MEDSVSLSYPSLPTETLAERFDLSPLCPANKRDNFSNLNRTPFESTGWNELEHHYGGVKQIYPHARRGITRFNPRWEKGEFFCLGKRNKDLAFYPPPLFVLLESELRLSKFEEVWEDLLLSIRMSQSENLGIWIYYLFVLDYSLKKLKLVLFWLYSCGFFYLRKKMFGINEAFIHGGNSKFLKITRNFNFKF